MLYSKVEKISAVLKKILEGLVLILMLLLVLVVVLQVFSRFIFNLGISWTEEIARTFFVYLIFIGVALVEANNAQTSITFIIDRLPRIPYFILKTFILVTEAAFLLFVYVGAFQVWGTASQVTYVSFPTVTYQILYIPFFIGMPLCMWFLFVQELELIRKTFKGNKVDDKTDMGSGKKEEAI